MSVPKGAAISPASPVVLFAQALFYWLVRDARPRYAMYVGSVWVCIQEETRVQKSRGTGRSTCLVCMCTLHVHAHRFARERRGPGGRRGRAVSFFFFVYYFIHICKKHSVRVSLRTLRTQVLTSQVTDR